MKNLFKTVKRKAGNSFYKSISDTVYMRIWFRRNMRYSVDLNNPQTFNEKLWWIHIFNRDPLTTICTDKVLVRNYVKECGLDHILNETYHVFDHTDQIELEKLPKEFFLKCNHISNGNFLCSNKDTFDIDDVKNKLDTLMNKNYYLEGSREWNYKNIEPKIICEKVLKDNESKIGIVDYRFFCFEGEAKFMCVDIETSNADGSHYIGAKRNVYDLEFNKLDIRLNRQTFDEELVSKPKNLDLMIKYANILSRSFVACRVDLYNIEEEIIFGEITFHQGGAHEIKPNEYQKIWGNYINLTSDKLVVDSKTRKKYKNVISN